MPYLDQEELYDQFKLDEPWDSAHNLPLLEQMPLNYRDPLLHLKPGFTNYLVPVGEKTAFSNKEGMSYRDIKDGTSSTLMVVGVTPKHAVPWTKPNDLQVEQERPTKGLFDDQHSMFLGAMCDGSARAYSNETDQETLWRLLGANDGEVVEFSKIK